MPVFILFLLATLQSTPRLARGDSTCVSVTIDPRHVDDVDFGGHRYDGPEHVRALFVNGPPSWPHFWLLDTRLDGAERYDTIAMSMTPDPTGASEDFIPLAKVEWYPGDRPVSLRLCWR